MRFSDPAWLAAGICAGVLLMWLWRRYDARQFAALSLFVAAHLRSELTQSISPGRRRLQRALYLGAVVLLFSALAGPQLGYRWEAISRRGNEIVFAVDTSRSMETPDVKPDRLTRAKLAIDDFANRLEGDAVGIVAFAGSAYLVCPITLDYGAFHEALAAVDTHTIPLGGTNISSAIHEAQSALRRRPGSDRILILVTDGEDLEGSAVAAAQAAKREDGLVIYTVGVGTPGGDLIPLPTDQGGGYVKDENGQYVKSHLDESGLKAIAAATGGFYVPLGTQGEGLETIAERVLGPLAKHNIASRQQKVYIERYQWPLAAALGLLLASLMVGTRRSGRRARARQSAVAAGDHGVTAGALLALLAAATTAPSHASAEAPANPLEAYNARTAAYRAGQFAEAAHDFQQSISHAPSSDAKRLADQEDAYYNLGNALYRAGQKTMQSSPPDTIKQWTDAVKAYETALQLRADDADSKYNRDLVKRKLDELQQPPPPQGKGKGQDKPPPGQGQQPPPPGQPPGQGQQPPPPGQPPGQGQQPPPPGQPPSARDPSPPGQGVPPPKGQPKAAPSEPPPGGDESPQAADNQHAPGDMSREEARELLDSAKGDEHRPPGVPLGPRDPNEPPPGPAKDW